MTSRRDILRLFVVLGAAPCVACLPAPTIPGTREGAPPQGAGCCHHKHCRYYPHRQAALAAIASQRGFE
jgi:hypothetical protein